jgi:hypothetical protein
MLNLQRELLNIARQNQIIKDLDHIASYNAGRIEFELNSYVLVEYPDTGFHHGPPNKMMPYKKGPMRVVNRVGSTITVENLNDGKLEDFHVTQLTKFVYDPEMIDPRKIAQTDKHLWEVEAIQTHRGNPLDRKENLYFKVKWLDITQPTWEPWSVVKDCKKLHEYLDTQGLKRIIKKRYRE